MRVCQAILNVWGSGHVILIELWMESLGGFWRFQLFSGGFRWFRKILVISMRFHVVLGGFNCFLEVLGGFGRFWLFSRGF